MSEETQQYMRPTDILASIIGEMIDRGVTPHYITTSENIAYGAGWEKMIIKSDNNKTFMLGMEVVFVKKNMLAVSKSSLTPETLKRVTPFELARIDGELMVAHK